MAFKMNGWSAFTIPEEVKIKRSNQPKHSEVSESMYQAVEDTEDFSGIPDYEEKYTPEEIRQGAGSSKDFISTSSGRRGKKTDWAFEGGTKQDKDISKRKRKAVFNPKTGKTEERYKSKFGIYRSTGRSVTDQAYIDAAKKKEQG